VYYSLEEILLLTAIGGAL